MLLEYDKILDAAKYVRSVVDCVPKIGIVCGSGLGNIVDMLERPVTIAYSKIPHFRPSTVEGHTGELVFGRCAGLAVVCMRGRLHMYEGYEPNECVRPVRLMALLGVEVLLVTNAAGTVNRSLKAGHFMIITDHISLPTLAGFNPLRGAHDSRLGDRFVTMSNAYDPDLVRQLDEAARRLGMQQQVHKGVYAMVMGPTYETVAEARALRMLGADAIGMSTVPEIVAAHQLGARCVGISLLTNEVLTDYDAQDDVLEHEQVVEMGAKRSKDFIRLILEFIDSVRNEIKVNDVHTVPNIVTPSAVRQ